MKEIIFNGLDEKVYYDKCDNGLKVYMHVNPKVKSTFMSLSVKYGSVHTEFVSKNKKIKVPDGSAHFLEHIKFNESDGTTAHDYFYKNGAEVNAFTTFEYTSYFVYALNNIEDNLNHLLDFVQTPVFSDEIIEKEKGIICEEEKMGEDDPDTINYFGIFDNLFEKTKYKNLITGDIDSINSTTLKDMENIFNNFYHPENMFMIITGNFSPYEMMQIIKNNQNKKTFGKYLSPNVIVPKEKIKVHKNKTLKKVNVTQPRIKIALKFSRNKFKDYSDLELRAYVGLILNMNFGSTSDYKDFLLENKLATSLTSMCDIYDDYFIIIISLESRFPDEVIKLTKNKLNDLELSKETFLRKNKATLATLILGFDDIEKVNYNLQDHIINYDRILNDIKNFHENLSYETLEDIVKLIDTKNISIMILDKNN